MPVVKGSVLKFRVSADLAVTKRGGYQVVPDVGDTYAVTSTSGGYAIPFPKQSGAMHVQVQHDGKALAQRDASLGDDNVKVDFVVE